MEKEEAIKIIKEAFTDSINDSYVNYCIVNNFTKEETQEYLSKYSNQLDYMSNLFAIKLYRKLFLN